MRGLNGRRLRAKRHAVDIAIKEFPNYSNKVLAELCAVHHQLAAEVRKLNPTESVGLTAPSTRIGLDGRERRLPPPPMKRAGGTVKGKNSTLPPPSQMLDWTGRPIPTFALRYCCLCDKKLRRAASPGSLELSANLRVQLQFATTRQNSPEFPPSTLRSGDSISLQVAGRRL